MTTKCSQCGVESEIDQAFSKERNWLGQQTHYCPTCHEKRQVRSRINLLLLFSLPTLCGISIVAIDPSDPTGWFVLGLLLFVLWPAPLSALHELAHATVAHRVHFHVFTVLIGTGKPIYKRRFRQTNVEIRAVPFGGATMVGSPLVPYYRLKLFLTYLAGPASHAILSIPLALLFLGPGSMDAGFPVYTLIWSLLLANVVLLLGNLIPHQSISPLGPMRTDGAQLLKIPFLSKTEEQDYLASYYTLEAMDACSLNNFTCAKEWVEKGLGLYPDNLVMRLGTGYILERLGESARARAIFSALLGSQETLKPEMKYILLNNIAYEDALIGDPELLPEADAYSAEAYKNAPWIPALVGTRGTVLVQMGQIDEGIQLLKKAMTDHTETYGKAANACILAIAEKRRGNLVEAQRYWDSARLFDPHCRELELAAKELASPPTPVPSPLS